MKKCLFLIAIFFSASSWAESCEQQDSHLAHIYKNMEEFGSYGKNELEKLDVATEQLYHYTEYYLSKQNSFGCDFPLAKEAGLTIRQSVDKKVRTFSWDLNSGGTLHEFDSLWQYQDQQGNVKLKSGDGHNIIDIFTAHLNDKTYYWLVDYQIGYGRLHGTTARIYHLEQGITPVKLLKTSSLTDEIGYEFDPSSEYDLPMEKRNSLIQYDDKLKILSLPVVVQTAEYPNGKVTNKRIEYKFDGQYFVR